MPIWGPTWMFSNWWHENSATMRVSLSMSGKMSNSGMPIFPARSTWRRWPKALLSICQISVVVVLLPLVPVTAIVWEPNSCRKISVWEVIVSRLHRPSNFIEGMPGDLRIKSNGVLSLSAFSRQAKISSSLEAIVTSAEGTKRCSRECELLPSRPYPAMSMRRPDSRSINCCCLYMFCQ